MARIENEVRRAVLAKLSPKEKEVEIEKETTQVEEVVEIKKITKK